MKEIKGYEGKYWILKNGKVLSAPNKTRKKFIFLKFKRDQYLRIILCKNGKVKTFYIHRLLGEAFIENKNNKPYINHKDENKLNNCLSNLEWVTAQENCLHSRRGLKPYKKTPKILEHLADIAGKNKKLTILQAQEIRKRYIPHIISLPKLAKEYGVCNKTILNILQNKLYKINERRDQWS